MAAPMAESIRRTGLAILRQRYVFLGTTVLPVTYFPRGCCHVCIDTGNIIGDGSFPISRNYCVIKPNHDSSPGTLSDISSILSGRGYITRGKRLSTTNYATRGFSTHSLTEAELKKEMEVISDQFSDTRELLGDARSSFGSIYFNEDLEEAKASLAKTLQQYAQLLERLNEEQKQQVARTIGLKMKELKAQEESIMEMIRDD